jgi:hypothetical protein
MRTATSSGASRNQVRVGPHKTDVPARDHLEDVARKQYAAAFAPVRPVQDGAAVEVSSQPNQCKARSDWLGVPVPELHRGVRTRHPLMISRVQVDRHSPERAAPLHHRGVVVRMGDRDARDAAQAFQQLDCGVIDKREAVLQHIAGPRVRKDRALPDAERRGGLDRRKPRREAPELVAVRIL